MGDIVLALVSIASGLAAATALGFAMRHHLHLIVHHKQIDR